MAYCNCDNPKKDHRYGPGPVRCINCKDVWKPVPEDTVESLRARIKELEEALERTNRLLESIDKDAKRIRPVDGCGDNYKGHISNTATGAIDKNKQAIERIGE